MIEDESYYWTVSRYIHLNPVRAGLAAQPKDWEWSSYPGYVDAAAVASWVQYETLLAAWRGDRGGHDAARAYRRYVEAGLKDPPSSPFRETFGGWVLGSHDFVERLRDLAGPLTSDPPLRESRQLAGLDPGDVLAAVTEYYGLEAGAMTRRHDRHIARSVAAWLCRRHTEATLSELAGLLGQSRADSVPSLVRRMEARLRSRSQLAKDVKAIVALLSAAPRRPAMTAQERTVNTGERRRGSQEISHLPSLTPRSHRGADWRRSFVLRPRGVDHHTCARHYAERMSISTSLMPSWAGRT